MHDPIFVNICLLYGAKVIFEFKNIVTFRVLYSKICILSEIKV